MANKVLTSSALVAVGLAGGLLLKTGETVVVVPDPLPERAEITGKVADDAIATMAAAMVKEGDPVTCKRGVMLDGVMRDDKEHCTDGKNASWVRDAGDDEETVIVVEDGKVYETKVAVADDGPK